MQDSPMSTSAVAGGSSWFLTQQEDPGGVFCYHVSFNLTDIVTIGIALVTLSLHLLLDHNSFEHWSYLFSV